MDVKLYKKTGVDLSFTAPPSKSYSHRALICAALADGPSEILSPLFSDDISITCRGLSALGVELSRSDGSILVEGTGGVFPDMGEVTIDCGNSGTSLRFLTTLSLLSPSDVLLTGSRRMMERPIGGLADAIMQSGGVIRYFGEEGCPPLRISGEFIGGKVVVDASKSSQFISSLMLCGPYSDIPLEIMPKGSVASRSYIDITADVMKSFGADVVLNTDGCWEIKQGTYSSGKYHVEGDYSSASYLFATAAVCGGSVTVNNLNPASVQGDFRFLEALLCMGCSISYGESSVRVVSEGILKGIEIDMSSCPDVVQTLAAVCVFAKTRSIISGISHLKYKESDRIDAVRRMVEGCGAGFEEAGDDTIIITPGDLHGFELHPEDDHRTAMSGAVIGLGTGDVTIKDAECVSKSYPGFWDDLMEAGLLEEWF
ncbi:3-phosphoshikimate 1-carboxyvinyltransferase [Methanoplanus sp. FWC-SCC4]|uniref:3-phosphoshikimate 1-carboxyvinyltransferase n=1 Tax=Methanochimaera problematica TaxID=2609417 RepID=A0AA97FE72_9EURY|nr:3-phosphoshikimate 1-carboxyvinyltransferase [Methanoplanus sp. FWC-SCC4]WOF17217.1 3-phosphoshikimate 1-carboxyvinyltransferase [Methanoplanus sp. FWC-SCC4]